ncbi:hypothetical protein CXB51_027452 [Gossypium anomalum]|uniref:Reverse transcriptase Ty1/copia-type domain-containing protein n=1 Tax=Gossypium anomalum TaxID=47600 RepID=A0A8J6CS18_9ROSI|nr:hypothetical protein CXB51_027452 [Gossypium anomalum]
MLYGHDISIEEVKNALGSSKLRKKLTGKAGENSSGEGLIAHGISKSRGGHSSKTHPRSKVLVYFLKHKDCVLVNFKQFKALIENKTGKNIKRLRMNYGLEYCSGEFNEFYKNEGKRARCMQSNVGLRENFWAEAINTAYYLVNKSPSIAIELKTLKEVWLDSLAAYFGLKVFSCPTYAHVKDEKLKPRRKEGVSGVEIVRFKTRLVAKGFSQKERIDYNEVFSPVVKHSSICVLLAMVAKFNLELE